MANLHQAKTLLSRWSSLMFRLEIFGLHLSDHLSVLPSIFLLQDKVSSFAALSPQELLRETQCAAGDNRMTLWHYIKNVIWPYSLPDRNKNLTRQLGPKLSNIWIWRTLFVFLINRKNLNARLSPLFYNPTVTNLINVLASHTFLCNQARQVLYKSYPISTFEEETANPEC